MKKLFVGLLSLIILMVIIPSISINADSSIDTEIPQVNVALDKDVSFYSIDGQTVFYQRPFVNATDPLPDNLITKTVEKYDYLRFDNSVFLAETPTASSTDGVSKLGWVVIDLGEAYVFNSVGFQFWNDWNFTDVVVQVANDPDFENYLTVYSNDNDNSLGFGVGIGGSYKDYYTDLQFFNFNAIQGRYIRVTNNANNSGYSLFSRIEVYGTSVVLNPTKQNEVAPVFPSVLSGTYSTNFDLVLTSAYPEGTIYYTTDGTYPTLSSNLYDGPIKTESLGTDILIRAIVHTNNVTSLPVNFIYKVTNPDVGKNVAAGLTPIFKSLDFTSEVEFSGFNGAASDAALLTDGSFNPSTSCIITDEVAWAVIDFGKEYSIGSIIYSAWHDWYFSDTKIELALSFDFSDAVTVFSNDGGIQNVPSTGSEYRLPTPVKARYLRVTNNAKGENMQSVFTEIQALVGEVGQVSPNVNIAYKNESVKAIGLDGTQLLSRGNSANSANDGTLKAIVDGDISSWGAVELIDSLGNTVPGWIYIDFGIDCFINQVNVSFWHDWSFKDIVIQLSTSEDFSTGVTTVFNNDLDDSLGLGIPTSSLDADIPHDWEYILNHGELGNTTEGNGLAWHFEPVKARYIRVISSGNTSVGNYSIYTEIQAITAPTPIMDMEEAIIEVSGVEHELLVANGSNLNDVMALLPTSLNIKDSLKNQYQVNGSWLSQDYSNDIENGETAVGVYTFTFVPSSGLPENVADIYKLLDVKVSVDEVADITALETSINIASEIDLNLYTLSSFSFLEEKLNLALELRDARLKTQSEVDDAVSVLEQALEVLELRGDLTELSEVYNLIKDKDSNLYTTTSFTDYLVSLTAAENALAPNGNSDLNQVDVDLIKSNLENASNDLVVRATEAELSEIIDLYAAKKALLDDVDPTTYTFVSRDNLLAILEETVKYETMQISETNLAQETYLADLALLDSTTLIARGNTTDLKALYDSYLDAYGISEESSGVYLLSTWVLYLDKMEVSKEVLFVDENNSDLNGNANLSQTDVDEVLAELKAAVEGLLLHGVKTSLRELLTLAEAVVEAEYTTSTYSVFKNALDAAMVVDNKADNLTTQAEVNEVFTPLDNAYKALVKRGNKSEMISKIDQYKTIVSSDYTASSYNAFKTAFDEAKAVNDNIDALQAEIDAALEDLTTKASSLVALGNKTELYNTISEAEALKKDDYKAENWEDLIEALDYAKSVSESNDVSEEDVEEANTLLKEAIESLQKKKKGCLSTTIMQSVLTGFSLMFALFIVRRRRF